MPKDKLHQLTGDERLGQERESEYLGAEDIDDSIEPILTITGLWNGMVTLQRGKENKDVLTFAEEHVPGIKQVRPLIVNSTNRKALRKLYKDAKASTLTGKRIQLYVDHNVRDPQDGGLTDGIRIRPRIPKQAGSGPAVCDDCKSEIIGAVLANGSQASAVQIIAFSQKRFGATLCAECMKKRDAAKKAAETALNGEAGTVTPAETEETEDSENG